jgi:hypothetical protein
MLRCRLAVRGNVAIQEGDLDPNIDLRTLILILRNSVSALDQIFILGEADEADAHCLLITIGEGKGALNEGRLTR